MNLRLQKALCYVVSKYSNQSIGLGDLEMLVEFSAGKQLVVELGTSAGTSTAIIAQNAKEVITIDVFERLDLIENAGEKQGYTVHYQRFPHPFKEVVKNLAPYPNIKVYQGRTSEQAEVCKDGTVDFLFIDADHSYEGVKKDYEAWFPKMRVGGVILFHDVVPHYKVYDFYCKVLSKDIRLKEILYKRQYPGASIKVFERIK